MQRQRLAPLLFCLLLLDTAVGAEEPRSVDELPAADSAEVTIDGVDLFRVSGSASFPADERASNVEARIVAAARNKSIAPTAVATQPRDGRIDIVAGGQHIVAVVTNDAALEGVTVADAAEVHAMRIREALTRYRAERAPEQLARGALVTVLALAAAALLLIAGLRGFRWTFDALERRYHSRVQSLTIQSFEVVRAESI